MSFRKAALGLALCSLASCSGTPPPPDDWEALPISRMSIARTPRMVGGRLNEKVDASVSRGLDWLAARQNPDGSWSNRNCPALTALPVKAFARSSHPRKDEIVAKGVRYLLSCVQKDGGIYRPASAGKGAGLSNYNTAICMSALHAAGDTELLATIRNARKFIAGAQYMGGDTYRGGFGYDRNSSLVYTDLRSTFHVVDAMAETASVEKYRPTGEPRTDIDWNETVKYIKKIQNTAAAGKDQAGGFTRKPSESKIVFRSYGSMTYSGMLALIHANVSKDDVRVRSAFDWSARHWSLRENPGMGKQGLYFFYNVLAKALLAYGQDVIPSANGHSSVNWRAALGRRLRDLQKTDPKTGHGYWTNDSSRFWENDPVLVTSYAILALQSSTRK